MDVAEYGSFQDWIIQGCTWGNPDEVDHVMSSLSLLNTFDTPVLRSAEAKYHSEHPLEVTTFIVNRYVFSVPSGFQTVHYQWRFGPVPPRRDPPGTSFKAKIDVLWPLSWTGSHDIMITSPFSYMGLFKRYSPTDEFDYLASRYPRRVYNTVVAYKSVDQQKVDRQAVNQVLALLDQCPKWKDFAPVAGSGDNSSGVWSGINWEDSQQIDMFMQYMTILNRFSTSAIRTALVKRQFSLQRKVYASLSNESQLSRALAEQLDWNCLIIPRYIFDVPDGFVTVGSDLHFNAYMPYSNGRENLLWPFGFDGNRKLTLVGRFGFNSAGDPGSPEPRFVLDNFDYYARHYPRRISVGTN